MAEPGREAVAGIILHRAHLGRRPERVGNALGRPLVIRRKTYSNLAIIEDRIVEPIGLLDLVQRLGDQKGLDPVTRQEGKRALEEVEPTVCRTLVDDRKRVVSGKSVSVRLYLGCRSNIKKKNNNIT